MKFRNLKENEIDVRVSQIQGNWCSLLLYKDARVDMDILDETVGSLNWKREHLRDNANCIVSIYDESKKEWISKEDTGTESFSEKEKGLASDSFKRACVNWGIGRELYTSPSIFIFPMVTMAPKGKDNEFYLNDKGKYETKTRFYVDYIDYDDNKNITDLIIRDNKGHIRFSELREETQERLNKQFEEIMKLVNELEEKTDFNREEYIKKYKVENIHCIDTLKLNKVKEELEKWIKKSGNK